MAVCMPSFHEVLRTLADIIGGQSMLRRADEAWSLDRIPEGTQVTYMCNESGDRLAAVVSDINATVYLGGKLILMPENSMIKMAGCRYVDETLADAFEEVLNMTRSVFNQQEGSEHLTPEPMQALPNPRSDDCEPWLQNPTERLDLIGDGPLGTMRIAFLFR